MRRIIALALLLPSFMLQAESGDVEQFEIPCSEAPQEAVVRVPEMLSGLAAITCSVYGHFLSGAEGVLWNYPGAFAPVIIPAQMVQAKPEKVGHKFHFVSLTAKMLAPEEATDAYIGFLEGFDERAEQTPPTIEILATNQLGVTQKVYLFVLGQETMWGYACQPRCKPRMAFMVLKFERQ